MVDTGAMAVSRLGSCPPSLRSGIVWSTGCVTGPRWMFIPDSLSQGGVQEEMMAKLQSEQMIPLVKRKLLNEFSYSKT